ncbi:DEAD-box RNA helicase [Dictyostelium discoideum AX4]|uniref:ATP-dependent RNA helicase ddx19 n=1 Tax=Dictyostelium discoideum TaxID=44689 RepID=DDX19_DICDI|nr:DEAD-box RNA helicase [Dictyostelium discoideum AX4]Q54TF8.1 RecName: Full=ATP-dependent RNA helicase ddx19; AltName: Full=ATP-dependent RNA helicase helC; AltName: Full=DEAD box protein 19 [Dictyostelium discoideum]EAL66538.1 DEAD-box RNA helicase [Dictyostelium discoideum AX4]|eukprot:XP_640633.1 DEAD-box RNA helicase [Dictyostelium discoideum AX4]
MSEKETNTTSTENKEKEKQEQTNTNSTTESTNNQVDEEYERPGRSEGLDEFGIQLDIQQSDPNSPLYSVKTFEELGLKPELLKGVYAMGYNKPSKIQEAALPIIIQSPNNLIAQSQSGTGKTAAFTLGMLNCVDPSINAPQAICISPTKELALQTFEVISKIGQFSNIKPLLYISEIEVPKNVTNQVIIGTPGKILENVIKKQLSVKFLKMVVLDEADFIVKMKNVPNQIAMINRLLPSNVKVCLFSATFSMGVEELIKKIVQDPYTSIRLKRQELSVEKIHQYFIDCGSEDNKALILSDIYGFISVGQSIVFVHTIATAKSVHQKMVDEGHSVSLLYGKDLTTEERFKQIKDFKDGKSKVLITTNVLARGIDIPQVSLVINYDVPLDEMGKPDPVHYLHRIGRVGRFGRSGVALSFVYDQQSTNKLMNISTHLGVPLKELKSSEIESLDGILKGIRNQLTPLNN